MENSIKSGDIVHLKSDAPSNSNKTLYMTVGDSPDDTHVYCYYVSHTNDGKRIFKELIYTSSLQKVK